MKTGIQIVLIAVIIVLAYLLVDSIMTPIQFGKEKDKRFEVVINQLKDIRNAQVAYKSVHGKYTGSFDTLIHFIRTDSLPMVRALGQVNDTLLETMTFKEAEAFAIEMKYITRDTVRISIMDTIFNKATYALDSLCYIPFSHGEELVMAAGEIETGSRVRVKVFEAIAPFKAILKGLDKQLITNLNAEAKRLGRYKGLKVGNVEEPNNNAGNWE